MTRCEHCHRIIHRTPDGTWVHWSTARVECGPQIDPQPLKGLHP